MRTGIAISVLCLLVLANVGAHAATIVVSDENYDDLGWSKTQKQGSDGGYGSIAFALRVENNENGLMLNSSRSRLDPIHNGFVSLSTSMAPGTLLSDITTFRIRSMETQGIQTEPIAVGLGIVVDGASHVIRPLPYETRGERGEQWIMEEYDLLGDMLWFDPVRNEKLSWTAFLAAYPTAMLATDAEVGTTIPSGQNFSVFAGNMTATAAEYPYGRDQRGQMDWLDIGFAGQEVTRYDFNVPEPSSIVALLAGLMGVVATRRRRQAI